LEDLGTKVEIVPAPAANGGYQRARIDRLRQIRDENKNCWWVNQYDNPANSGSYGVLAGQLLDMLGRIDCLIGSVGSGGSVCGTSNYLRALFPELYVVGVDTFGSVLFGQPDRPRQLRGLGNSLLPRNLDHAMFDEAHWVSAAEAFTATRLLHRKTTLFRGGTSGAVWMVAQRWAAEHPNARVVCLFPDDGTRYVETIYNDDYLSNNQLLLPHLPQAPRKVRHPLDASDSWSLINWNRRSYQEVMGCEATVGAAV
jgi:cysteine synthase A